MHILSAQYMPVCREIEVYYGKELAKRVQEYDRKRKAQ